MGSLSSRTVVASICLTIPLHASSPITAVGYDDIDAYNLKLVWQNIDGSSCGDWVDGIFVQYNNGWIENHAVNTVSDSVEYYYWPGGGPIWSELPISAQITMTSGRVITMPSLITDLEEGAVFTSDQYICEQTEEPSKQPSSHPTIHPSHRPTTAPSHAPTATPSSQLSKPPSSGPTTSTVSETPSMTPSHPPTTPPTKTSLSKPTGTVIVTESTATTYHTSVSLKGDGDLWSFDLTDPMTIAVVALSGFVCCLCACGLCALWRSHHPKCPEPGNTAQTPISQATVESPQIRIDMSVSRSMEVEAAKSRPMMDGINQLTLDLPQQSIDDGIEMQWSGISAETGKSTSEMYADGAEGLHTTAGGRNSSPLAIGHIVDSAQGRSPTQREGNGVTEH